MVTPEEVEAMRAAMADKSRVWRPQDDIGEAYVDAFVEEPSRDNWTRAWAEINREAEDGACKLAWDDADRVMKAFAAMSEEDRRALRPAPYDLMSIKLATLISTASLLNRRNAEPVSAEVLQAMTDRLRAR
jgi:hypothetical protein